MQYSKAEGTIFPNNKSILVNDKLIDLSTPVVMGVINITPDSFYSGSRSTLEKDILSKVNDMLKSGATIIDLGGYSSRPGAENISSTEEIGRVIPAIESIRTHFPDTILSLDTFRSEVANAGLNSGANMINDISGFQIDPKIVDVVAKHKVPYILMHMIGTPQNMQKNIHYDHIFNDLIKYFSLKISHLQDKGVKDIIIDPGFGFSKNIEQNHFLLNNLEGFQILDKPILAGLSRKSMIYKKLGITPEESLEGTIALNAIALSKGASILRVHDVKEAVDLVRLMA